MAPGKNIKIMKVKDQTPEKNPLTYVLFATKQTKLQTSHWNTEGLLASKDWYMKYIGQVR